VVIAPQSLLMRTARWRDLMHTDKRTGKQKVSLQTWADVVSAKTAVAKGLGKIEWKKLKEPPPAA
jgi:hypothetical protein